MANERFENIWDAIEADPVERERMKLLSQLMSTLQDHIRQQGWTQSEAAGRLNVTQPRVSDLMRGKIALFSIDAIVGMLAAAGMTVEFKTRKAA
ncbi:MAG: XRE family transcriptional regulator [Hyphomicrobiales bacterium]|nr:MAG: XRE family transcriptional regulator [Hyphomicrobiales bacterium]